MTRKETGVQRAARLRGCPLCRMIGSARQRVAGRVHLSGEGQVVTVCCQREGVDVYRKARHLTRLARGIQAPDLGAAGAVGQEIQRLAVS